MATLTRKWCPAEVMKRTEEAARKHSTATGIYKLGGKTLKEWLQIEKERDELKEYIEIKLIEVMKELQKNEE